MSCRDVAIKLLVLSGTAWVGQTVTATAVAAGHEVRCLDREVDVPVGAVLLRTDRDGEDALAPVAAEHWDAVIDVARQPIHVRRAVRDLEPMVERYLFVSSGNVYASQEEIGQNEDALRLDPLDTDVMASMEDYGAAKVACENAVLAGFGNSRTVIARAGLIGGPGDLSGRSGYWPWRFAHPSGNNGAVLVPDVPELPTAVIDVRDLAAWLADHGVSEWSGPRSTPLRLADRSWCGMNARSNECGLELRPLSDTLAAALHWERTRDNAGPHGAGLTDSDERELLAALT